VQEAPKLEELQHKLAVEVALVFCPDSKCFFHDSFWACLFDDLGLPFGNFSCFLDSFRYVVPVAESHMPADIPSTLADRILVDYCNLVDYCSLDTVDHILVDCCILVEGFVDSHPGTDCCILDSLGWHILQRSNLDWHRLAVVAGKPLVVQPTFYYRLPKWHSTFLHISSEVKVFLRIFRHNT